MFSPVCVGINVIIICYPNNKKYVTALGYRLWRRTPVLVKTGFFFLFFFFSLPGKERRARVIVIIIAATQYPRRRGKNKYPKSPSVRMSFVGPVPAAAVADDNVALPVFIILFGGAERRDPPNRRIFDGRQESII